MKQSTIPSRMRILFWSETTAQLPFVTGLQHVVRRLGTALEAAGCDVVAVGWDGVTRVVRGLGAVAHGDLSFGHARFGNIAGHGAADWLLLPETSPARLRGDVGGRSAAGFGIRLVRDQRGAVAAFTAVMAIPMLVAVGVGAGFAQLAETDTWLQDAVDNSALAGAAAYTDTTQNSIAQTIGTNYIGKTPLPAGITLVSTSVSAAQDPNNLGYDVTVTATAKLSSPILSNILSYPNVSATATARNPSVKLTLSTNHFAASAADWNSVYYYPVPMQNGQPQYNSVPSLSSFYEVGSNCNGNSINWSSSSRCNTSSGGAIPNNTTPPTIGATQPIAFVLENMTAGLSPSSKSSYVSNAFGSKAGNINYFSSAFGEAAEPPSQYTNYYNLLLNTSVTVYPTTVLSSAPNCSLIVQVVNPSNLPTSPPSSGSCFPTSSTTSGYQYGALSCAQMNGNTYMFWWNDMGGPTDDHDYNDAYFTVSCTIVGSATGNTQVVLIK